MLKLIKQNIPRIISQTFTEHYNKVIIKSDNKFDSDEDYANPIEPSAIGGMKMAKIIKEISDNHDFSIKDSVVYK